MTGAYMLKIEGGRGVGTGVVGASLTAGTPTHHLHPDCQIATVSRSTWLSLGGSRRLRVEPGDVVVLPPRTLHSEGTPANAAQWYQLELPREAMGWFAGFLRKPIVVRDPQLAAMLVDLVTNSVVEGIGRDEFLERICRVVRRLARRDDSFPVSAIQQNR